MAVPCTCPYEYDEDKMRVRINCVGSIYGASVEDFPEVMARVMDILLETKRVTSLVLAKEREYEYDWRQLKILQEVASVIEYAISERLLSYPGMAGCVKFYPDWNAVLQYIVLDLMRKDPIGAYVEILREIRNVKSMARKVGGKCAVALSAYAANVLDVLRAKLEDTQMVRAAKPHIIGYHIGDRTLYRQMFNPSTRPNFMFTRYMVTPPEGGRSIERYVVGDTKVEIFKLPHTAEHMYFAMPPEFTLSEEKYMVLDASREYMAAQRPKTAELLRSERVREVFYNIGRDVIKETADRMRIFLSTKDIEMLASILTRYTAGFGVLEILLADEKIQDIYINPPIEKTPILIFHADWQECKTNLIPTREDAEAWATRLRIQSGRPLDEANPVLDTDISLPMGAARFAVITKTLSPEGLGFAIRRHRYKPWTLPLFMKQKMLNPLAAGLLSFLIDGSVAMLIAGGRGAGKTSLLASLMLEILPRVRIVTIEDSVAGDTGIVYQNGGEMKTGTVGGLIDNMIEKYGVKNALGRDILASNPKNVKVFAMDSEGKIALAPVSRFIRHKVDKDIYEIETQTGRKISVTCDHSLFTMGEDGKMVSVRAGNLSEGSFIVTPRALNFNSEPTEHIDLLNHLGKMEGLYVFGGPVREVLENKKCLDICKQAGYSKGALQHWRRRGIIPAEIISQLSTLDLDSSKLSIKAKAQSRPVPAIIALDKDFLSFIGLWLADGCYDKSSVIMSVVSEEERQLCKRIAMRYGIETKMHSDNFSLMLNSVTLKKIMKNVLGLEGNAYTKHLPAWAYRLSKEQIAWLLKGLFSGDGCVSNKEILLSLCSEHMMRDVQTLLLAYGAIFRMGGPKEKDKTWRGSISSLKSMKAFRDNVGFLQESKASRLCKLCEKVSTHDTTDIIPLPPSIKEELSKMCGGFNKHDYITRGNQIGREKLRRIMDELPEGWLKSTITSLVNSDIYWDRVRRMKSERKTQYVYDFSVPGYENFVCNNILAHNTLELPVEPLVNIGYNISSLKSRSVITRVETEMPADEALRTSLRLGDSALIVGEIRSVEAKALWEAMRIGALSNVVAGTIHGESAYGVYDRVVNDLGVPPTSFKATDIIVIAKMLRSADGLYKFRRVTEIVEVRKKWEEDPMREGGFVNLMEYSSKEDTLKPTDTLVNGESEVLNRIASLVKEWSGNWSVVWDNIQLRGRIKQTIVEYAAKLNKPDLLEAEWTVRSNAQYHLLSESVRKELGYADPKAIYDKWLEWFRNSLKI